MLEKSVLILGFLILRVNLIGNANCLVTLRHLAMLVLD
jgi:hypothetical protein